MRFKLTGKTKRARDSLIEASKDTKHKKSYELTQENPPILIITHHMLGKWMVKFCKKLKVAPTTFYSNSTWVNTVRKKVLDSIQSDTKIDKKEFKVEVLQ